VVVVWGNREDAATGAQEIIIRAREATVGVPSETRQALLDGTNGFERILPGPDRMYPDTDLPPKRITQERLDRVRRRLPVPVWLREERFRELGLGPELAANMAASAYAGLLERASTTAKISPGLAASLLLRVEKLLKKHGLDPARLDEAAAEAVFARYRQAEARRDWLVNALLEAARNGRVPEKPEGGRAGLGEVERAVRESAAALSSLKRPSPDKKERALVGLVMRRLEGRADGAVVSGLVRSFLEREAR
jgi:glutamyl-tRNA(Gln) amidotransferase subunit E